MVAALGDDGARQHIAIIVQQGVAPCRWLTSTNRTVAPANAALARVRHTTANPRLPSSPTTAPPIVPVAPITQIVFEGRVMRPVWPSFSPMADSLRHFATPPQEVPGGEAKPS